MKKLSCFVISLSLSVLLLLFFSCKKQDAPSPDTLYDTLKVNSANTVHNLSENTILTLDATMPDANAYLWMPGNITTPAINITEEGNYTVKITTTLQEYNYEVLVLYQGSDCFIPNSFTPNDDGINDIWHPLFSDISDENFSLYIYDKDNVKLFSSTNKDAEWNGVFNGTLMPAAYYYYVISYQTLGGEIKTRNGMLQLVL